MKRGIQTRCVEWKRKKSCPNLFVEEGEFEGGMLHGQGKKTINGRRLEGEFKDGKLYGGEKLFPDGSSEKGILNLVITTDYAGKNNLSDGTVDKGHFKNDKLEGLGRELIVTDK